MSTIESRRLPTQRTAFLWLFLLLTALRAQSQNPVPLGATITLTGDQASGFALPATIEMTVTHAGSSTFAGSNGGPERGLTANNRYFSQEVESGATFYRCDTVRGFPARLGGNVPQPNRLGRSSFIAIKAVKRADGSVWNKIWLCASVGAFRTDGTFTSNWEYQVRYTSLEDPGLSSAQTLNIGTVANADRFTGAETRGGALVEFPKLPDLQGTISKEDVFFPTGFRPMSVGIVTVNVVNNAVVPLMGSFELGFYLSSDPVFDPGTDQPLGLLNVPAADIPPGGSLRLTSLPLTLPNVLPTDNFYILAPIDLSNRISEHDETNNTAAVLLEYFTLSGRVLDRDTEKPLDGVQVEFGPGSGSTGADGQFRVRALEPSREDTAQLRKPRYEELDLPVERTTTAQSLDIGDILLPLETDKPVVMKLDAEVDGYFIEKVDFKNTYKVAVKWKRHDPGHIEFSNGTGSWKENVITHGQTASVQANLSDTFTPSLPFLRPNLNRIEAVAVSREGVRSEKPLAKRFSMYPFPDVLLKLHDAISISYSPPSKVGITATVPSSPKEKEVQTSYIGKWGMKAGVEATLNYEISDGSWDFTLSGGQSGQRPALALFLPNREISGNVSGKSSGSISPSTGLVFKEFEFGVGLQGRYQLGTWSVVPMLGPFANTVRNIPPLYAVIKNTSIDLWGKAGLNGSAVFDAEWEFQKAAWTLMFGLEAVYEPQIPKVGKAKLLVGGDLTVTSEVPDEPFKQLRGKVYLSLSAEFWEVETVGPWTVILVDLSTAASGKPLALAPRVQTPVGSPILKTTPRHYLDAGTEQFVWRRRSLSTLSATSEPPQGQPEEIQLIKNVHPNTRPAIAAKPGSNQMMLLYTSDPGTAPAIQRTDVSWTFWDGSNWSAPAPIANDVRGEFNPRIAWDGNGDAIAVWQRIRDAGFNRPDLEALAAQMEIVWSRWNPAAKTWSQPAELTANEVLDHGPLLCGPLAGGRVLAVWARNQANALSSPATPGDEDQVFSAMWDPAAGLWTEPARLLESAPLRGADALAGRGKRAIYAWVAEDLPVPVSGAAASIHFIEWDGDRWSNPRRLAAAVPGSPVQVGVAEDGRFHILWQQGEDLVIDRDGAGTPERVQAGAGKIGLQELHNVTLANGTIAAFWQAMSPSGPDLSCRVFDSHSRVWNEPSTLTQDDALEHSLAATASDSGELSVVYAKTLMGYTNQTMVLENGESLTITNAPSPGRVDLVLMRRPLGADLAILPGDLTASAGRIRPGAPVEVVLKMRNLGDLPATNAVAAFYNGDPARGGTLITNLTLSGRLPGRSSLTVTQLWTVPEPARSVTLFAVADPDAKVLETTRGNNTQSMVLGETDLAARLANHKPAADGSLRIVVQVENLGLQSSGPARFHVARQTTPSSVLGGGEIPAIGGGRLAQVPILLPPGTQPEGEAAYIVVVDPEQAVRDKDRSNNQFTFAAFLWLDSDRDGLTDSWELQNGFSATEPNDTSQDVDGDGLTTLQEFLAGTDPRDAGSYLRVDSTASSADGRGAAQVRWGSVSGRLYSVLRTENLEAGFQFIARHLRPTPPQNTYEDNTVEPGKHYFYRIAVE